MLRPQHVFTSLPIRTFVRNGGGVCSYEGLGYLDPTANTRLAKMNRGICGYRRFALRSAHVLRATSLPAGRPALVVTRRLGADNQFLADRHRLRRSP